MFNVNDKVIHPGMGVCTITDIKYENFGKLGTKKFYVLSPFYGNCKTVIFVPTDSTKIVLKKLLSEEEIVTLLNEIDFSRSIWVDNDVLRKEAFFRILKSGDRKELILMLKELHERRIEKESKGKRLHINDEKLLQEAEKIIHEELAFSMNISIEKVGDYIVQHINK